MRGIRGPPISTRPVRGLAELLSALCECPIELNRESTPVEDGDTLLIARLIYRVNNPAAKGQVRATLADYEFFWCEYSASPEVK